jgi:hypothetical protein
LLRGEHRENLPHRASHREITAWMPGCHCYSKTLERQLQDAGDLSSDSWMALCNPVFSGLLNKHGEGIDSASDEFRGPFWLTAG